MNRYVRKSLKVLLWLVGSILLLIGLVYILIQAPGIQDYARKKAVAFLRDKIKTPVTIGKFTLDFPRRIILEDIYFEDQAGDTLLAADTIRVDISLWKLLNNQVEVKEIDLRGIYANINRTLPDSAFNFDYITRAFIREQKEGADTAASLRFSLDKINLDRIRIDMDNEVTGNNMYAYLHHFDTRIESFDLDQQKFKVPAINISGFTANLRQTKALSRETVTTDTLHLPSPFSYPDIELGKIELSDIHIEYGNTVTAIESNLDLGSLQIEFNNLNLPNQSADVKMIRLDSTSGSVALGKTAQKAVESTATEVAKALEQGGWEIQLEKLELNHIDLKYDDLNSKEIPTGIDYKHIEVTDLVTDVSDITYKPDSIAVKVNQLSFKESSGLDLRNLKGDFFYGPKSAGANNFAIQTPKSFIGNKIEITYPSFDSIQNDISRIGIYAEMAEMQIAVSDLLLVAPTLSNRELFKANKDDIIFLNGKVSGHVGEVSFVDIALSGIGDIHLRGSGNVKGLPDVDRAYFDVSLYPLQMSASDIKSLVPRGSISSNIRLPDLVTMRGDFNGTIQSFTTKMNIQSGFGGAYVNGTLKNITSNGRASYNATFQTSQFNIGKLLKREEELGKISMNLHVIGSGTDPKTANAKIKGEVSVLEYKGYRYQNLVIDGSAENGNLQADASMNDPNFRFDVTGTGNLSGEYPRIKMTLDLDTLNLQKLNLHDKALTLHGKIIADLETVDPDYLNGTIHVSGAIISLEGKRYRLDTISIVSVATPGHDSLDVYSEFLTAHFAGNYNLTKVWPAIQYSIDEYFDTTPAKDSIITYDPQQLDFEISLIHSPLVEQVLPDLKEMENARITGNFDSSTDEINIEGDVLRFIYKEITIDSFNMHLHTVDKALNYAFHFDQLTNKDFQVLNTTLSGKAEDDILSVDLNVDDAEKKDLYRIAGEMKSENRLFKFELLPDGLLLNKQPWNVSPGNSIQVGKDGFMVQNFTISNNAQSLQVNSNPQQLNAPLEIDFKDFKIETFTRLVTKDSLFAGGTINGTANVRNINTNPVFTSDLTIADFSFHGDTLGNISMKVNNETANTYAADVRITGDGNDVSMTGYYFDSGEESRYDLNVDIANLHMKSIEGFTSGEIDNSTGSLRGALVIKGTMANPNIRGDIRIEDVETTVTRFNARYKLRNEHLEFTDRGLALNNFTLVDSAGNEMTFSGFVYTTDYRDFDMNLDVQANDFQVMNSTRENNKLYFGRLFIDTHMHIRGGFKTPVVDGSLKVNEKTNLTIVIPQEEPGIVEREGIVKFVDMDTFNFENTLVLDDSLSLVSFTGMDVAVDIAIDREAELNLIIDEANGDYLNVKGTANLTGGIDPSGKVTLTGLYDLDEGTYRFSFNQIKREFVIRKGSTIQWTGEPLKAEVNIIAVYVAETAPLSLVQSQLAEAEQNVVNTYKQKIPFDIILTMKGELMRPDITFDIELPEKNYGVSGEVTSTVRARLVQLRTEPSELNKQVFAVLILNRFITEDPFQNEAREGGITSIARQSASKILSEQLNNIIGGAISGFDVNFDINTIEDYTTGDLINRTDLTVGLSKQLLDDRLKISVGSHFELEGPQETDRKATNIAGDVSIEYQLSKDGRYLVRAYRKDEYIIVQGQVVETGIGFVFTADYNQLKDLFTKKTEEQKFLKKQERQEKREHDHE